MKILIAESSTSNRTVIAQFVERFGGSPLPAANGAEALELFASQHPDLILLDAQLDDIDGCTVARRMRALETPENWTPIIFLSAQTCDRDIEKCIAAGGDDFLIKPVSQIVLGAKMRAMQRLLQMRASMVALTRKLDSTNKELRRISTSDALTGIANRRVFDESIASEWRRARRHASPLALLMCDVDHFKHYNDTYGHRAGDECLRQVAAVLDRHAERASDIAARYGGEEFAVILPETTLEGALIVAERICESIADLAIPHAASSRGTITLSIGIAVTTPASENLPDELILAADRALYRAKDEGRNCVRLAELPRTSHVA